MSRIAFLGLGAMGRRMAAHLVASHDLVVYNRTASRADVLVAAGATRADTPRQAAEGADVVITMLTDDAAARQVWLHPETGALAGMSPGALAVESSTVTPGWIAALGEDADAAGVRLVDAPVAGSTPQAEARQLAYLIGGAEADVADAMPVLTLMGAKHLHVGPRGQGAVFKLVVNALFATQVAAISELLKMAADQGLSEERTLSLLRPLPVTSPAAAGVAGLMLAADHASRFPVDLVAKDLRYAVSAGAGPVVAGAQARFEEAAAAGHGALNLSAVHLL